MAHAEWKIENNHLMWESIRNGWEIRVIGLCLLTILIVVM